MNDHRAERSKHALMRLVFNRGRRGFGMRGSKTQKVAMPSPSVAVMLTITTMILGAPLASGQTYPGKPIRIIATGSGNALDFAARLIAQGISPAMGQQVIVENRGDGTLAAETVAKAPADGYTLLVNGSNLWLLQFLRDHVPWDPLRDFSPITLATNSPNLIAVHPSLPTKSVRELIGLAKSRPGTLNYGTSGTGGTNHIAGELFKVMAGVNIVRINYKGTAPALIDLIGGQLQLMFANVASATSHIKSGRLRILAVTSAQPTPLAPGVPTVSASGVAGYEAVSILGIFAPAGIAATVLGRLNQEIVKTLNRTDVKEKFFSVGVEAVGTTPEELAAKMKSEMTRLGKVIRDAGIRDE